MIIVSCKPKTITTPEGCLFGAVLLNSIDLEDKRRLDQGLITEEEYQSRIQRSPNAVLLICALSLRKTNVDGNF
ncbi:SHOCT domain-containing protein [Leptospira kemamanensis]|uniref:SHOCT domain-containing protein n=1 Tax=Leptospira kemamanensis TaxID=2484942 RepID=A0A4R9JSI2_9LEPT|nr:SHOCT domain-containing protein [Leptospira kemamanensis]TGL54354.1 SHOCT domain-containing protein [Leptospira kemamanensis]